MIILSTLNTVFHYYYSNNLVAFKCTISFRVLVAFADFLLCIFLYHGTVALCHCLKHT